MTDRNSKRKSLPRGVRNTLIALGVLVGLVGIGAGIIYAMVSSTYDEVQKVSVVQDPSLVRPAPAAVEPSTPAAMNILLLGSDNRTATNTSAEQLTGFRSDTILVAQVAPNREDITIMSIMRDNWVAIQGVGEAKINAAFAYGGLPLAVNTVENFIGARIDHVVIVDFVSFAGLTDAVGGVTVNNTIPFARGNHSFEAGEITLNGDQSLTFVRERYAFADGDYQRVRNQQAFLKGLMQNLLSAETLTSPAKLTSSFMALKPFLIVDDGLNLARVARIGSEMTGIRSEGIRFFTSPTLGTGASADGQSIVIVDEAAMVPIREAFAAGTLNEWAAANAG